MDTRLDKTARQIKASADSVQDAVETVQDAAERVDKQVLGSVEPKILDIRHRVAEVNEKTDVRLKRLFWGVGIVILLQVVIIGLLLAG